jgi:hypothetical protein
MAYIPYSPQVGATYVLTHAGTGWRAVFNDPADSDYVGMLVPEGFAGLDSAEVREATQDLTESDGGAHGNFYFGRRPITMTVRTFGHADLITRETRIDKLRRVAHRGLRSDLTLTWQNNPVGALTAPMMTWVRLQQPTRTTGGWVKDTALALVSQFAPLFSQSVKTSPQLANGVASVAINTENQGDWPSHPIFKIWGPGSGILTNPTVTRDATVDTVFRTTGLVLAVGEVVEFDMLTHEGRFLEGARAGQSANRYIDFTNTDWPTVEPGTNTFRMDGTAGGQFQLSWRDVWS